MKKTKSLLTIVLAGLLAISINSCTKFDEGGLISSTEKNLQTGWDFQNI